jgi:hypothetical protein
MAAWIRDPLCGADAFALAGRQFGQAEHPVRRRAVRRAGVDQAGARVRHERRRLARRVVGQAEEGDIRRVQQAGTLGRVLAAFGSNAQHLDVGALGKILVDAQSGRSFLTVDENLVLHLEPRVLIRVNPQHTASLRSARQAGAEPAHRSPTIAAW